MLCKATPTSTPVLVVAGLIVPGDHVRDLVWDFLQLKKRFNPSLATASWLSDVIRYEVKGADLRADIRSGRSRRTSRAIGIIDRTFELVERRGCRLVARAMVKTLDRPVDDKAAYVSNIGWICKTFHQYLENSDHQQGLVILDSRTKVKNTPNADVVTTQVFKHGGNPLPRLVEVPVFGHSDSHVVLQIADVIVSAVLFPAVCSAYCADLIWNHHAHGKYEDIRWRYGTRLKNLQFRYYDATLAFWKGGVHVYGATGGLAASKLFSTDQRQAALPGIPPAAPTPLSLSDGASVNPSKGEQEQAST